MEKIYPIIHCLKELHCDATGVCATVTAKDINTKGIMLLTPLSVHTNVSFLKIQDQDYNICFSLLGACVRGMWSS